jgi:hypothetical protein
MSIPDANSSSNTTNSTSGEALLPSNSSNHSSNHGSNSNGNMAFLSLRSADSVSDILREEALKSVVSIELNSLGSIGVKPDGSSNSQDDASNTKLAATAAASFGPPPARPRSSSTQSQSSGQFLQAMLRKFSKSPLDSAPALTGGGGTAAATSATTSAKAVEDLTSSRNWNNLGQMEDINITEVFQTQQDNAAGGGVKAKSSRTKKIDWNALMQKGLAVPPPPMIRPAFSTAPPSPPDPKPVPSYSSKRARSSKLTVPVPSAAAAVLRTGVEAGRVYHEPTENDVLLGRGGRANNHVGNKRYLKIKEDIQDEYMKANKNEKTVLSQKLVEIITKERDGRFLKLDEAAKRWYVVDNLTARKKASQTLREVNTAEVRAAKRAKYSSS